MTGNQLRRQAVFLLPHGDAFAQHIGAALEQPGHPLGQFPVEGSLIAAEALRSQDPHRKEPAGRLVPGFLLLPGSPCHGGTVAQFHCLGFDGCTKLRTDTAPIPQCIGNCDYADRELLSNIRHFHAVLHGTSSCPPSRNDVYLIPIYIISHPEKTVSCQSVN